MNVITVSGRVGRDVDVKFSGSGTAVCKFVVAVDWWKGKDKEKDTDWFEVVCFKNQAEFAGNNLTKGKLVTVNGSGHFEKWEKDGIKHQKFVIYANDIVFEMSKKAEEEPAKESVMDGFGQNDQTIPF